MQALSGENLSKPFALSPNSPHSSNQLFPDERRAGKKYLVFYLTDEIFAVSARQVSEVVQMPAVTPLPNFPDWLLGIVNLRGEIITVADLSKFWKKKAVHPSSKTKIVVLRGETSKASIAVIADKLGEIITLPDDEIQTAKKPAEPQICGQAAYKSNILSLLDAEKVITSLSLKQS